MKSFYKPLAGVVVLYCLSVSALSAQTVVNSFAPYGTTDPGVWFENDVRTGGTAAVVDLTGVGGSLENDQPLPIGAAQVTTDFTNPAKGEVGVGDNYGIVADILATLEVAYSWYKAFNPGQNVFAAPSIKLSFLNPVCTVPGGDCWLTLVYEPYVNGPIPVQDAWHDVVLDLNNGLFWSTGGFGSANGAGGPPNRTLAGWSAALHPDFQTATLVMVSVGVGSYNQGQIGYFDDVRISHAGYDAAYDFEPPVILMDEKADVLAAVQAMIPSGDDKTDKRLQKAVDAISKSLSPEYWVDGNHLTDKGKKVFDEEKKAVKELMKIKSPPAGVDDAIASLVAIDEALAQIAVDEAIAGAGDEKDIEKAVEEFDKSDKELGKGKFDKAITHYKHAWQKARKALGLKG